MKEVTKAIDKAILELGKIAEKDEVKKLRYNNYIKQLKVIKAKCLLN